MNVLYLAHRIPYPPDKGDKIRSFRQLEYLARRHRVWCACFVDTPADLACAEPLRALCQEVVAIPLSRTRAMLRGAVGIASGGTITESYYRSEPMARALRAWSAAVGFDVVVAFSSSMAAYAFGVPAKRRVLDLCDLDSRKWLDYANASGGLARWMHRLEGRRLSTLERDWIQSFDATLLITQAEASGLDSPMDSKLHVVGNGVALGVPHPSRSEGWGTTREPVLHPFLRKGWGTRAGEEAQSACSDIDRLHRTHRRPVIGFVGTMDYRPNVDAVRWFVSKCWPGIRNVCPNAVFQIVGRSPTRRVRRLGKEPGVEVVGAVDDAAVAVRAFDVSVAPMRIGRGLQNKVLEAMAASRPVVLTSKAAAGIGAEHGREYLVADDPKAYVDAVARLAQDETERERLGRAARRYVAVNHCWEEMLRKFELIVTGVLERTARRRGIVLPSVTLPSESPAAVSVP